MAIADPKTVDLVQFSPEQIGIIGITPGTTDVTLWFEDERDPLILLVQVFEPRPESARQELTRNQFQWNTVVDATGEELEARRHIEQQLRTSVTIEAEEKPFLEVIRDLQKLASINMTIDVPALEEEGLTTSEPVSLALSNVTLRSALKILLDGQNLDWVIENETLKITTRERAAGALRVESYSIDKLLQSDRDKGEQFTQLIELVTSTIDPDSWSVVGGEGTISAFPGGDALVIRQHEGAHQRIKSLFESLRQIINRPATGEAAIIKRGKDSVQIVREGRDAVDVKILPFYTPSRPDLVVTGPRTNLRLKNGMPLNSFPAEFRRSGREGVPMQVDTGSGSATSPTVTAPPRVKLSEGRYEDVELKKAPQANGSENPATAAIDVWNRIGVVVQAVKPDELGASMNRYRGGLRIVSVRPDSAASKAEWREGDILVGLDTWELLSLDNAEYVLRHSSDKPLKFYLVRKGETLWGTLNLETR